MAATNQSPLALQTPARSEVFLTSSNLSDRPGGIMKHLFILATLLLQGSPCGLFPFSYPVQAQERPLRPHEVEIVGWDMKNQTLQQSVAQKSALGEADEYSRTPSEGSRSSNASRALAEVRTGKRGTEATRPLSTQNRSPSWVHYEIDEGGTRPAIDLDSQGNAYIGFWKAVGSELSLPNLAEWDPVTVSFNYYAVGGINPEQFLSLVIDFADQPHMSFHDHGADDLAHAYKSGETLALEYLGLPVHDGFSSSIAVDSENHVHISFLPECCGTGSSGVEHAWYDGTEWTVEYIGSGPDIWVYNGTSLAIDSQDRPHITYYHDASQELTHAVKTAGVWSFDVIDSVGDVGRLSSLAIDANDNLRVAYLELLPNRDGVVKYAEHDGTSWLYQNVDTLIGVSLVQSTQGLISLALDPEGVSHILYTDSEVLTYATIDGGASDKEVVVDYRAFPGKIGSRTSLVFDASGRPHIAYWLQPTDSTDLIVYATRPDGPTVPLAPSLVSPPDGSSIQSTTAIVFWNTAVGAITYRLQVARDEGFSDLFLDDSTLTETWCEVSGLESNETYYWRVRAHNATGWGEFSEVWDFSVLITGVYAEDRIPAEYMVSQNYPNPFNPSTRIDYALPWASYVRIDVYNVLGERVVVLKDGLQEAGYHNVVFDGTGFPSGLYIYRLQAGDFVDCKKLILMK